MSPYQIERLNKSHNRESFDCGVESLNLFLRTLASQYEKKHLGKTYVAARPDDSRVAGFYTISASSVVIADARLPKHPLPCILMGRLAVDRTCQKAGLGARLLVDFFDKALRAADTIGVYAVHVHAIDDQASTFYKKFGFLEVNDQPRHLYLPIKTVEQIAATLQK